MPPSSPPSLADPTAPAPRVLGTVPEAGDLRALLDRAAQLSATDGGIEPWRALRADAVAVSRRLAANGIVPAHLVVEPTDPPIVVERSLLVLSRHLDRLYAELLTGSAAWESSTTADA
jgi:hypothetical protein